MQVGTPPGSNATGRIPPGQMLNQRYRIVKLVGQGGMGAVYKAEDLKFGGRVVAAKEMSQSNLSPQEAQEAAEQFKQEAQMLAGLKHPNLPSIYDYFGEGGRWYLVMDFIEGTTLEERINKASGNRLTIQETLDIGIQLAKVLGYLHNRPSPIIFRDLKPLNIMITPDDNVYLIDFGIARLFKPGKTKDTVSYVSAGYAAPEQYGRAQTSPQSDIYSLGATLHQLLSGNDPSSNYPLFTFKPLHSYNSNVPTALADLIANMVSTDPTQRPANMAMVRQELEKIQMQVKQGSSYVPPTPKPTPPPSPNPYYTPPSPIPPPPPPPYYASSGGQVQQNKQGAKFVLPKHRFWKSVLIGTIVAIILITFDEIFHVPAGSPADIISTIVTGLLAGMLTGRFVVLRRFGILTGCVVGIVGVLLIIPVDGMIYHYNFYPFFFDSTTFTFLLIYTVAGAILSLLGVWIATIRHPYYKKP